MKKQKNKKITKIEVDEIERYYKNEIKSVEKDIKKTFKYYKLTFFDGLVALLLGGGSMVLFFAGIWIPNFRWRFIFTSWGMYFLFNNYFRSIERKDNKLRKLNYCKERYGVFKRLSKENKK